MMVPSPRKSEGLKLHVYILLYSSEGQESGMVFRGLKSEL